MNQRTLLIALIAVAIGYFGVNAATASAQTPQQRAPVARVPQGPPILTAALPDLHPIPSRIENGVVSVRNAGNAANVATYITVTCHKAGQTGGCPEIPAQFVGPYTDPDFPNALTVPVPPIQPGHVYNHNLTFWAATPFPAGVYVFEFVADAPNLNAESNEANNAGAHVWNKP